MQIESALGGEQRYHWKEWVVVPTSDGSHTLASKDGLLTFHSRHGAMTESRHVFIQSGLEFWLATGSNAQKSLRVLEMGLGSGLNAALVVETWKGQYSNLDWSYTAMDTHLLDPQLVGTLNYGTWIQLEAWEDWLKEYTEHFKVAELVGKSSRSILYKHHQFNSQILKQQWTDSLEGEYDVIFYDAFGPSMQPDLWGEQAVQRLAKRLAPGGVMVTYGAQGAFRRFLTQAQLEVHRLPGPPGKREMLRAVKG
jgi:tRNA U34 5-methylaminomethyl-2-thiouridine-forming methyltransferase MnmC